MARLVGCSVSSISHNANMKQEYVGQCVRISNYVLSNHVQLPSILLLQNGKLATVNFTSYDINLSCSEKKKQAWMQIKMKSQKKLEQEWSMVGQTIDLSKRVWLRGKVHQARSLLKHRHPNSAKFVPFSPAQCPVLLRSHDWLISLHARERGQAVCGTLTREDLELLIDLWPKPYLDQDMDPNILPCLGEKSDRPFGETNIDTDDNAIGKIPSELAKLDTDVHTKNAANFYGKTLLLWHNMHRAWLVLCITRLFIFRDA